MYHSHYSDYFLVSSTWLEGLQRQRPPTWFGAPVNGCWTNEWIQTLICPRINTCAYVLLGPILFSLYWGSGLPISQGHKLLCLISLYSQHSVLMPAVVRGTAAGGWGWRGRVQVCAGTPKQGGGLQKSKMVIVKVIQWQDNFQDYAEETLGGSGANIKTGTKVRMMPGGREGGRWYLFPVCSPPARARAPFPKVSTRIWPLGGQIRNICCCINVPRPPIFLILQEINLPHNGDIFQLALLRLSSCTHHLSVTRGKQILLRSDHWKGRI